MWLLGLLSFFKLVVLPSTLSWQSVVEETKSRRQAQICKHTKGFISRGENFGF